MSKAKHNDGLSVSEETEGVELQLLHEKNDASRQDSVPLLFSSINSGNFDGVLNYLDQTTEHINSTSYGGLTALHAACHMQQLDILKLLIKRGAKIDSFDSLGNTALHVAVRTKWYCGVQELLEQGASPNQMSEPPTNITGQLRETPLHAAVRTGDIVYVSLMLKYKSDLSIRDRNNYSVFHLAAATRNAMVLKLLMKEPESGKILESIKNDANSLYHAALPASAKVENEPQIMKVIQVVYKCSDDVNVVNLHGETPLMLACRLGLPNVAKFLLTNGADPTQVTRKRQSTLHAACLAGCPATLRHLLDTLKVSHLVLEPDNDDCTPFYYAVESASIECCKILLRNGDHLTYSCKDECTNCALVLRKFPAAMQLFKELFDAGVKVSKKPHYDQDFNITFDYSVLMSSERENMQCSIASELSGTSLEFLIKHPLLESFLFMKWGRIKDIFYFNVIQYLLYLLLHTTFVMLTYGKLQLNWEEHEKWHTAFTILHIIFICTISFPAVIVTLANLRKILLQWETYTRVLAMTLSAYIIYISHEEHLQTEDEKEGTTAPVITTVSPDERIEEPVFDREVALASLSVLFIWVELMMLLGRFPALGTYILMFTKVSKSLIKFILAFISLIFGFSMSFHILFQKMNVFENYSLSFAKTIMMMTGEIAYSEFVGRTEYGMSFGIFSQVLMTLFVFMVTIIMSNLLIGLAVNDIPHLKRMGKIKRLVKQAAYLMAYERVISYVYKKKCFPAGLRVLLSSRCSIKSEVAVYPNKISKVRGIYTRQIPDSTVREAIALEMSEINAEFQPNIEDDVNSQLKSFQIRYSSDRRSQRSKFEELSLMCGEIKRDTTQIQSKIDSHMDRISTQLQQQLEQNQEKFYHLWQKSLGAISDQQKMTE